MTFHEQRRLVNGGRRGGDKAAVLRRVPLRAGTTHIILDRASRPARPPRAPAPPPDTSEPTACSSSEWPVGGHRVQQRTPLPASVTDWLVCRSIWPAQVDRCMFAQLWLIEPAAPSTPTTTDLLFAYDGGDDDDDDDANGCFFNCTNYWHYHVQAQVNLKQSNKPICIY